MFYGELPFGKRFGECSLSRLVIATAPVFVWYCGSYSTGPPNGTLHTPRLQADASSWFLT